MYGVTDKGFELKRLDVICDEIYKDLSEGFGVDVGQQKSSLLNVLVTTFANQIANLWETAQDSYYEKFPATATGVNLDNAVQYGGIRREPNKRSLYMLHCTGDDGTKVKEGTAVATNTSPEIRLRSVKEFAISRDNFHAVSIRIVSVLEQAYKVSINGNQYVYNNTQGMATEEQIASGIAALISDPNYVVKVTDGVLHIEHVAKSGVSKLTLSENLTTESVTSIAGFETQEYGKIMILHGVINKIIDNVPGLHNVANYLNPILGRLQETDIELRQSYLAKSALRSSYMAESIKSELLTVVPDVKFVSIHENDKDITDENGIPPHAIEIIVEGGSESLIAETILRRKAGGIQTHGNTKVDVVTEAGDTIPIRFQRPEYLYTWIKVDLHGDKKSIPTNFETLAKKAVLEFAETMVSGDDLYVQKLMKGIYETISGVEYVDIYTFFSKNIEVKSVDYMQNANIAASSRQKILVDERRIEVVIHGA